ncbi:MAG: hypothetical protein IKX20_08610 [Paludibacteraceae bacterium]|nr:hypothetical protein [Paludibacteraceae bacterium]
MPMDKKSTPLSNEQIRELMRLSMRSLNPKTPKEATLKRILSVARA